MSPEATSWFVIIMTIVLIVFDVYLSTDDIVGNTYSNRITNWGRKMKWFPFALSAALGVLIGHWFL